MPRVLSLVNLFAVVILGGCGGGAVTVPVTGNVTYQGQPADGAQVVFTPEEGRTATGVTDAEGNFTLSTLTDDDGAVPGKHVVTISEYYSAGNAPPMPGMGEPVKSKFPTKYANPRESGFTADVKEDGENVFQYDMK